MTPKRRHYTAQEKVAILKRHLLEKVPVSDLCDQYGIHPTLFYNWQAVRLHSAIGYVTPKDKLEGREAAIFTERDRKLEQARARRKAKRQAARQASLASASSEPTT